MDMMDDYDHKQGNDDVEDAKPLDMSKLQALWNEKAVAREVETGEKKDGITKVTDVVDKRTILTPRPSKSIGMVPRWWFRTGLEGSPSR